MDRITIFKKFFLFAAFSFAFFSFASTPDLIELRLKRRFGVGLSAFGELALFGIEADINISEELSIGTGIGTGLHYSSFMVKARYFLLGENVNPYFGFSFLRWWTDATKEEKLFPPILREKFLPSSQNSSGGFDILLVTPLVGVQFMHITGLSLFVELQYLFKLFDFKNGLYAGLGIHFYI